MSFHLVPQERAFYRLFCEDIAVAARAARFLQESLGDESRDDKGDLSQNAAHMREIEHQGDAVTALLFGLLDRTFITPFEREDIIALAGIIDTVTDHIDEVSTMSALYSIERPSPYLMRATRLLVPAVEALDRAIGRLESLKGLEGYLDEVHRLENEGDILYQQAIAELFAPGVYEPIDIIKWKSLYDLTEQAFDACEDVGNVLKRIVIKNG